MNMLVKQLLKHGSVPHVGIDTRWRKTQDLFQPLQHRAARVAEVVQDQKGQPCFCEGNTEVRANIAGSASHEYHGVLSNSLRNACSASAMDSDISREAYCPIHREIAANLAHIICATR